MMHAGRQARGGTGDAHELGEALPRGERLPQPQGGYPHRGETLPGGGGLGAAEHDFDASVEEEGPAQQDRHRHGAGGGMWDVMGAKPALGGWGGFFRDFFFSIFFFSERIHGLLPV